MKRKNSNGKKKRRCVKSQEGRIDRAAKPGVASPSTGQHEARLNLEIFTKFKIISLKKRKSI